MTVRSPQVRLDALPPFRPVVTRLLAELSGEPSGFRRIRMLVSEDPALAAHVLRLANSALFGCRRRVSDLLTALTLIGLDRLRALVLTYGVRHLFRPLTRFPLCGTVWRHSLATALLAADLSLEGAGDMMESYTAGLLHDLGRLVLLASAPDRYPAMVEQADGPEPCAAAEQAAFGLTHAEAGAGTMRRYKLPDRVVAAALLHHHPDPLALSRSDPEAALIASSCRLASSSGFPVIPRAQRRARETAPGEEDPSFEDDLCLYLRERVAEVEVALGLRI